MTNDIFRNKVDFARAEFATELPRPRGVPKPREASSQKAQLGPDHAHSNRKDVKVPMKDKQR